MDGSITGTVTRIGPRLRAVSQKEPALKRQRVAVWTDSVFAHEMGAHAIMTLRMAEAFAVACGTATVFAGANPGFQSDTLATTLRSDFALDDSVEFRFRVSGRTLIGRVVGELATVFRVARARPSLLYASSLGLAPVLAPMLRIPTILDLHGTLGGSWGPRLLTFLLKFGRRRTLVVANSEGLAAVLESSFPALGGDVVVAGNGVAAGFLVPLDSADPRRPIGSESTAIVVGYVGSVRAGRGIDLIASLAAANEDLGFLIAGQDHVSAETEQLRGLTNVTMLGQVPHADVPSILRSCDILLMPYEASVPIKGVEFVDVMSPMKAVEYMASGRAIIASDLSAIRRVMDPETALFCSPDDFDEWQAALDQLRADAGRRRQLGDAARASVSDRTWTARARRLVDTIEERLTVR